MVNIIFFFYILFRHLGMYKPEYMPINRGFDVDEGYLQGCGSEFTHIASCCHAGSNTHDENYTCDASKGKDYRGFDWFKNGEPDFSANETNSAWLIRDGAINYLENVKKEEPFFMYLPF